MNKFYYNNSPGISSDQTNQDAIIIIGQGDASTSLVEVSKDRLQANNVDNLIITVIVRDLNSLQLEVGGYTVIISATDGTVGTITDNKDGTYTATLTASGDTELVIVSATLAGNPITDTAEVEFYSIDGMPAGLSQAFFFSHELQRYQSAPLKMTRSELNTERF